MLFLEAAEVESTFSGKQHKERILLDYGRPRSGYSSGVKALNEMRAWAQHLAPKGKNDNLGLNHGMQWLTIQYHQI